MPFQVGSTVRTWRRKELGDVTPDGDAVRLSVTHAELEERPDYDEAEATRS